METRKHKRKPPSGHLYGKSRLKSVHPIPENFEEVCGRWAAEEISGKEAARQCNMPASSFYRKVGYMRVKE